MKDPLTPTDPGDFEKLVAVLFKNSGYNVIMPPQNTKGYDIELKKGREHIAVQAKNQTPKCNLAQIQKFQHFLELPICSHFTSGWFISSSGFSRPALTHLQTERPKNIALATYSNGQIIWDYPAELETATVLDRPLRYFGVFTSKGGVGKTTVAAHLAGAFALMGYDVILLDLDPDKNLRKLFLADPHDDSGDASLFVPPKTKTEEGATITVLNHDQWKEHEHPNVKIVICDCSPVLSENPPSLVERFDYCIIPTTLNPLGIAKKADVIIRTLRDLREINTKAQMFIVINAYDSSVESEKRNKALYSMLSKQIKSYTKDDTKCKLIHPSYAKIRHSNLLFYWGYHIVEGSKPQLAFNNIGGRCHPRIDFLQLAEYLENHTDIESLLQEDAE